MLPNFLIIGAPRAATTWIARNMMTHPNIFMPSKKELHFFDQNYEKGIDYYKEFFKERHNEKAVGEATPAYFHTKQVPELIKKDLPDIKLIVSLRNPIDRLYSRYLNSKARFKANREITFEEKILNKKDFIEEGYYFDHLMRYYHYFSKENMLIIFYEEIKNNPDTFFSNIFTFLEVDNINIKIIKKSINSSTSKGDLAKLKSLWYFQRAAEKYKFYTIATILERLNKNITPSMNQKTREWLYYDFYKEQIDLLEDLIKKDLSDWRKITDF